MAERTWARLGGISTSLTLAVRPVDVVTGGRPAGAVRVTLDGAPATAANPSGYRLFLDEPVGPPATLRVTGPSYVDVERPVGAGVLGDPSPAVEVGLNPSTAYSFGPRTTLLRGHVEGPAGDPLPGVRLDVAGTDRATVTDAGGEFALALDRLESGGVDQRDGQHYVTVRGQDPEVAVDHDAHASFSQRVAVRENAVTRRTFGF